MQELFGEKPWVQPLAVAGSHLDETENENGLEEKEKSNIKYLIIDVK